MRLKIEKWQLNFLKQDAHRSLAINRIGELLSYKFIDNKIKEEWINIADEAKNIMYRQVDEIKYQSQKITILFAPACMSFDQYENFEERGKHFTKLIKKYSKRL